MPTWVIGWSIRKFNSVLTVFLWGILFRMVFGESDWIAILTTSFFLAFTLRR
ncbi:Uncharacterised protein [Klebsiella pneumoniae]|nr:Uncharacterised protein [Klebsiella pneumoniae]